MKNKIVLGLLALVFLVSCQQKTSQSTQENLKSKVMVLQKQLMKNTANISVAQGDSMVDLYIEYANTYPDDSISVEYLYRAAGVQMGMEKNKDCLATLTMIEERYPKSDIIPSVLQLKAFIYDTKFQDFDKAKAAIDELIEKFPDDKLVPNAKAYRDMIGKDPEELFRRVDSAEAVTN
ncbi:MAG: hypothetical protein DSY76_06570 [Bacteroidetes bacterium]|nr:MAG: hypothetical protein DSY76_06570 [Bacteroidota bacterium]